MKTGTLVKVAKILAFVLPAIGGAAGTWASTQEMRKTTIETTEKCFSEHIANK